MASRCSGLAGSAKVSKRYVRGRYFYAMRKKWFLLQRGGRRKHNCANRTRVAAAPPETAIRPGFIVKDDTFEFFDLTSFFCALHHEVDGFYGMSVCNFRFFQFEPYLFANHHEVDRKNNQKSPPAKIYSGRSPCAKRTKVWGSDLSY